MLTPSAHPHLRLKVQGQVFFEVNLDMLQYLHIPSISGPNRRVQAVLEPPCRRLDHSGGEFQLANVGTTFIESSSLFRHNGR